MICLIFNPGHVETIDASDFKARCLAILDGVQATGERVVILKSGRAVAELLPASRPHAEFPQLELKRTVIESGDIVGPAVPEEHWESLGR
ncbi:MAG: type II toxin-antitoxin system Phd/YefM family antitoxin [Bryobacterales bacterium]|nr:type II toxin-antitoxin system Phd/YefM family antitoxin [Bryobacterales bacterium]